LEFEYCFSFIIRHVIKSQPTMNNEYSINQIGIYKKKAIERQWNIY